MNNRAMRLFAGVLLWVPAMLSVAPRAEAQALYGSIVGDVTDASNAPVPGAAVRIVSRETNQSRETRTNDAGGYSFPTVPSGTYDVTVSKDGFQTVTTRDAIVSVDGVARVDATLRVGAVTE